MAGTITPYDTAAGKRYRVRYRKPDKSQTDKRGFKTRKDAQLFLASVTISKATGEYIDPANGRRTVASLAGQWERSRLRPLKPSSRSAMETAWRVHVEPKWGHRAAASITSSEINDWIDQLNRSAQTVRRAVFVLSGLLQVAERDRIIRENPVKGVTLPAKTKKPKRYLTYAQLEMLADRSQHPDVVRSLGYSGLRWGEHAALRVRNLNFLRRRISVEENAVIIHGAYRLGTPKTGESRTVPMFPFLVPILKDNAHGKSPDAFVFGDGAAPLPYPHATSGWFVKAVRAVRATDLTFPVITPHDLRHTAASLAVSSGANVKAVQRMLGHASAAMTLDVYADLFDDDLESIAERVAEARAAAMSK